jgi:hypothetical protein
MTSWFTLSGQELLDASNDGTLGDLVPSCSSIYVWSREICAPEKAERDPDFFIDWINSVVMQTGAFIDSRELAHCVTLSGLKIGGGQLTQQKQLTLERFADKRKARKYTIDIVESLTRLTPPIYVGNANNFLARIKQHLNGDTDLSDYLHENLNMDWPDLKVDYINLNPHPSQSEDSKAFQELLELLAQRILAPIGTKRPG